MPASSFVQLGAGLSPYQFADMTKAHVTVWYDGACPLCRKEIAAIRWLDRRQAIRFIDVARDGEAQDCPLDRALLLARFHAMESGQLLSGAAAFGAMWRAIPLLRPVGLLVRLRPVERVLEKAYGQLLRLRPRLQRLLVPKA